MIPIYGYTYHAWRQTFAIADKEVVRDMVKGLSKRVVTVRFPESHLFEQAIFMVREDRKDRGVSAQDVIREACSIAERHAVPMGGRRAQRRRARPHLPPLAFIGIGSGLTGLAWLLTILLG